MCVKTKVQFNFSAFDILQKKYLKLYRIFNFSMLNELLKVFPIYLFLCLVYQASISWIFSSLFTSYIVFTNIVYVLCKIIKICIKYSCRRLADFKIVYDVSIFQPLLYIFHMFCFARYIWIILIKISTSNIDLGYPRYFISI